MNTEFICPNCGGEVPGKARACPHCGSDENTGWSDTAMINSGGLEEEFDYDEALKREFGTKKTKSLKDYIYAGVAVVIIILFFLVVLKSL